MKAIDSIKTRRGFLKLTGAAVVGSGLFSRSVSFAGTGKRPNIVWLMAEDLCKHHLRLYEKGGAPSPAVEAMAESGIVFDKAFCNGPVCSVARTSLITGCFAPRIGTHYHRKIQQVPMPDGLEMFPAYLRQAGYYTSNSTKRDYNCDQGSDVWDQPNAKKEAWRNRPTKDTPFFHVSTFTESHEGKLHFKLEEVGSNTKADPADMKIQPQHPDTELFRYTYARHQDRIMDVDNNVAKTIKDLENDGLLEDTFVIYFGDNGGTLPGSKGYVYETGLHVPLVVRVPENFKHLVPATRGKHISGFVSFIDFAPTMLNLAGVNVPEQMDGRPFMGKGCTIKELNKRDEAFGHADRFDELYYTSRTLRKGTMKYIRNYEPYLPSSHYNQYRFRMQAFKQWGELYKEGKLNSAQAKFFKPNGPEELYDLTVDPYETVNLANDPKYAKTLADLRRRLQKRTAKLPDLGIIPECVWLQEGGAKNPVEYGQRNKQRIAGYIDTADLMLLSYKKAAGKIKTALKSDDPLTRFWALTVCAGFGQKAKDMTDIARELMADKDNLVRCRAALFMAIIGQADPQPAFKQALRQAKTEAEALYMLNDLIYLQQGGFGYAFNFRQKDVAKSGSEVKRRLDYFNWKP